MNIEKNLYSTQKQISQVAIPPKIGQNSPPKVPARARESQQSMTAIHYFYIGYVSNFPTASASAGIYSTIPTYHTKKWPFVYSIFRSIGRWLSTKTSIVDLSRNSLFYGPKKKKPVPLDVIRQSLKSAKAVIG